MLRKKRVCIPSDWEEFERGKEYNFKLDLYDKCAKNERFYRGDQWGEVKSEGLPTPVFNLFKRIIGYYISSILGEAAMIRFSYAQPLCEHEAEIASAVEIINSAVKARWDKLKMDNVLADALLDAALSGDAVMYTAWDSSAATGQKYSGDIISRLVETTNVFFGDPNSHEVQTQPYILIASRELCSDLKAQAKRSKREQAEIDLIEPDDDIYTQNGDRGLIELDNTKCISLIRLWRGENGNIFYRKSTKTAIITDTVDTGLSLYPVCYFNWTRVKNSWHGEAVGTTLCDNQIFINKAFAMAMKHMMDTAFSKVIYDSTVIDTWSNRIGEAIAVNGNVDNVAKVLQSGSMQSGMLELISMAIRQTKEFMGATDTALGDVDPKNTSAIIALQQASSMPLQNVKRSLYGFIEDLGLIWLDFMMCYYDSLRLVPVVQGDRVEWVKFSPKKHRKELFSCTVDVGATSYFSEIATINTLDALLTNGKINMTQYLERLPKDIIPKKQELIEQLKKTEEMAINE